MKVEPGQDASMSVEPGQDGPVASEALYVGKPWYVCQRCPMEVDCSEHSWKRAKVWEWTLEACYGRLIDHLSHSSLHRHSFKDEASMRALIETTEIEERFLTEEDLGHYHLAHAVVTSKRHKTEEGT